MNTKRMVLKEKKKRGEAVGSHIWIGWVSEIPVKVQDFKKITDRLRGICKTHPRFNWEKPKKVSTGGHESDLEAENINWYAQKNLQIELSWMISWPNLILKYSNFQNKTNISQSFVKLTGHRRAVPLLWKNQWLVWDEPVEVWHFRRTIILEEPIEYTSSNQWRCKIGRYFVWGEPAVSYKWIGWVWEIQ